MAFLYFVFLVLDTMLSHSFKDKMSFSSDESGNKNPGFGSAMDKWIENKLKQGFSSFSAKIDVFSKVEC